MSNEEQTSGLERLARLNTGVSRIISFRGFLTTTLVGTYLLMLVGSYTKAIHAGLACPDWPKCYGTWLPFLHPEIVSNNPKGFSLHQIMAEWTHRGLAMIIGFMILGTTLWSWSRKRRAGSRKNWFVMWSSVVALVFLPLQVVLGALTVTEDLEPVIVTTHLGTATIILMALTVATAVVWYDKSDD